ncbi:MAG: dihydrolipoamide acetyltransferase family protein, partial [Phycisphaerales bacterium]
WTQPSAVESGSVTVAASTTALSAPGRPGSEVTLSGMRQTIARRLVESKQTIPHYQVTVRIDMDPVMALRKDLNAQLADQGVKLSVNDFIVRGCAVAKAEHPFMNASWAGDRILLHGAVNIGVAVSLPAERGGGLVVPTIRDADRKSLRWISEETKQLAEKARTKGLSVEEMSDATFTVSNLGMFGVEHFTAVINPPNSAILACGAALEQPVVRNGALAVGHEMQATLSLDHRVIDGAMGAAWLATLKHLLEHPATLLV